MNAKLPDGPCAVRSCTDTRKRRDWCGAHYQRWLKYGNPEAGGARYKVRDIACSVDACSSPVVAKALCQLHYYRAARGVPLAGPSKRPNSRDRDCSVDGCERKQRARGWCDPHYKAWQKSGDPLVRLPCKKRASGTGAGWLSPQGYWMLHRPDHPNAHVGGRIPEHVVVMTEVLGRPLRDGENVHHKNGLRADNRPENLELWAVVQPYGQRVRDLVEFANWINERYGTDPTAYP